MASTPGWMVSSVAGSMELSEPVGIEHFVIRMKLMDLIRQAILRLISYIIFHSQPQYEVCTTCQPMRMLRADNHVYNY